MKFLPNINRTSNCWNRSGIEYTISVTLYYATNNWNSLNHEISHDKKKSDPWNTYGKTFWTHQIHTRKNFGSMTHPREKCFNPQNNHEKKLWIHETPKRPRWYHGTRPKRPTIAYDPLNLAHSVTSYKFFFYPFDKILKLKKRTSIISYCSILSLVWELFEIKGKQRIYLELKPSEVHNEKCSHPTFANLALLLSRKIILRGAAKA